MGGSLPERPIPRRTHRLPNFFGRATSVNSRRASTTEPSIRGRYILQNPWTQYPRMSSPRRVQLPPGKRHDPPAEHELPARAFDTRSSDNRDRRRCTRTNTHGVKSTKTERTKRDVENNRDNYRPTEDPRDRSSLKYYEFRGGVVPEAPEINH